MLNKPSVNQSQNKSKVTPQTTRYWISGMDKYFKFKQAHVTNANYNNQEKQIKKVKSLKNLKSWNNGVQSSNKKKIVRGTSPMVPSKSGHKIVNNDYSKHVQVKPLTVRESLRYPSQNSLSTSTSTRNLMLKSVQPNNYIK